MRIAISTDDDGRRALVGDLLRAAQHALSQPNGVADVRRLINEAAVHAYHLEGRRVGPDERVPMRRLSGSPPVQLFLATMPDGPLL